MWSAEEDLKWCGNLFIGCGFVMGLFGICLSAYLTDYRGYVLAMFILVGLGFVVAGGVTHYFVWRAKDRKTIKRGLGR